MKHVFAVTADVTFTFTQVVDRWTRTDIIGATFEGQTRGTLHILAKDADQAVEFFRWQAHKLAKAALPTASIFIDGKRYVGHGEPSVVDVKLVEVHQIAREVVTY